MRILELSTVKLPNAIMEGDLTFLLAVRASEERRTTARGLQKSAFQGSTSWIAFYLLS